MPNLQHHSAVDGPVLAKILNVTARDWKLPMPVILRSQSARFVRHPKYPQSLRPGSSWGNVFAHNLRWAI